MATKILTTPPAAIEAPPPSPLATAFAALLTALDRHIAAERNLSDVDPLDTAYCAWLEDAEAAQDALYGVLATITALTPSSAEDLWLRRMALVVATLVREGTASAFRLHAARKSAFAAYLTVPAEGRAALRVARMVSAADARITQMSTLSLYRQDGVDPEAKAEPDAELLAA